MRRIVLSGDAVRPFAGQQVRGKKKLAKVPTINVRLLQPVDGYGREGKDPGQIEASPWLCTIH
jgi:hypothetical protein